MTVAIPEKPEPVTCVRCGVEMAGLTSCTVPYCEQFPANVAPAKPTGGGLRFNTGKNALDLIPPEWIWGLGMVLTRGAIKYAKRNWEKGMAWSFLVGCAFRHILYFVCGQSYDKETGCHHLAMAAWNCLALMSYDIRKIGENDLAGNTEWLHLVAMEPGPDLAKLIADQQAAGEAARKAATR